MNKPKYIIIHCSAVSEKKIFDQFKSINIYHRDTMGFPVSSLGFYVGYHVLITGGKQYKCKEDTDTGAHCNQVVNGTSMNYQSMGICIGFNGDIEFPSDVHYKLLKAQVLAWQDQYKIPNENVKFHREYATWKTCPGKLITKPWLDELLTRVAPPPVTPPVVAPVSSPSPSPMPSVPNATDYDTMSDEEKKKLLTSLIVKLQELLQSLISIFNKK